ncbi:putative quinol monooxygenase [Streptomyces sp. NPDC056749]|uniref:putative quinol monooxygenase n=1 Tax=Streptomyces sp. NPDC056749 TaxID=3345936 RepID=UPI0036BE573B
MLDYLSSRGLLTLGQEIRSQTLPLGQPRPLSSGYVARAKAGEEGRMLGEIQAVIGLTRKEDGCEQYVVHTTPDQPGAFAFYERWPSGARLLTHVSQPFMQTCFAAIADMAEGELEAHWLHPLS